MNNQHSIRTVATLSLYVSILLLVFHCYYSCYPLFDAWSWTTKLSDQVLMHVVSIRLIGSTGWCKTLILLFLALSILAYRGRKGRRVSIRKATWMIAAGVLLYYGSFVAFARLAGLASIDVSYIILTVAGWLLIFTGGMRLTRLLMAPRAADDPFGERQKGFPQEEGKVESDFSLHLHGRYTLEGKERESWINLANPRRGVLILGSPGCGKSRFIIEPLIRQWMEKGYALFLFDFKYDALSRLGWGLFQRYHQRYPSGTAFYSINFSDLSRSHRCNLLEPSTLEWVADAIGASRTILLSMNKSWIRQQGEFWVESPVNFLAALIWYLRKYKDGCYCTLPHVIELAQTPYDKLFTILQTEPEVQTLIQSFIDAYRNKSMEMVDGQITSARIPLSRLASPDLYYILTGNDLSLDINDPKAPKIFCLGGNPARQEALAPVLSLYIDRLNKLCNRPDRYPCAFVCDEFATVRAYSMTTTIATGRSNNIVPILAVQDLSQLRTQYSKEEADLFLNISGNLLCGQVGGETAKWVSERFPKVLKDRQSVSTNSADTSVSISQQWEPAVTQATIATLSSGEFVGVVADDPGKEMELKAFHAKIVREEGKEAEMGELPVIRTIDAKAVQDHFLKIRKDIVDLVEGETRRIAGDARFRGMIVK
jgi:YWFCY protein/TraM recognition site of TraD and TraG